MESIKIRDIIANHLALSNKLQIAAKEVLENVHLFVMDAATKYGLDYQILVRKFNTVKRKEEFYERKRKFDPARKEIIEGGSTYNYASNIYGINIGSLYQDVRRARAKENYEYDRRICSRGTGFTYLQEESLLKILINWATGESFQRRCSCQLCALEKLLTFAYEFAQQYNIKCPLWDTSRQASINWLIDFEMRHSDEISCSFHSLETCLKQIQADE